VLWGAISALAGGRVDNVMMRIVDILYGLPYILLVILMKVALEGKLTALLQDKQAANIAIMFVAIGSVSWLTMARVIRGQVLSLREMPFVEAARSAGVGPLRILARHLLPNLVGPIIVYTTLTIPQAILQESFLSFLGIGVAPPIPTWGSLAAEGVAAINTVVSFWWMLLYPCLLLGTTLLALNFVGDGLRDAFDPRATHHRT
jgi:oligopeptide transport system permease protein